MEKVDGDVLMVAIMKKKKKKKRKGGRGGKENREQEKRDVRKVVGGQVERANIQLSGS